MFTTSDIIQGDITFEIYIYQVQTIHRSEVIYKQENRQIYK